MPISPETALADDPGDPRTEYAAARESAALFDLAGRTQIQVTGRDRAKFLHNFCTNDIVGLAPGGAREAFITNVQGKVLAYVSVCAMPEALWLTSVPGCADRIIAHLSRYQISEEVTFTDRSAEVAALLVAGPQAPEVVGRSLSVAATLGAMRVAQASFEGDAIQVRRHDFLLLPCLVLVAAPPVTEALRPRLTAAGARPAGRSAFEALRIEAGFPLYGVDLTEANLAQEAGRTKQAISFTKGCYLGQEPIARIDALGHVNQQLRGLRLASGTPPAPGSAVLAPDAKKVGQVTSSALSYSDGRPVALAYVRRGFETPGTALDVQAANDSLVPARVFWPGD
jgi:hypothetical protein